MEPPDTGSTLPLNPRDPRHPDNLKRRGASNDGDA